MKILVFSKLIKEEITALPKVCVYKVKDQENTLIAKEIYESDIIVLLNTENEKADMILIEITTEKIAIKIQLIRCTKPLS
ncbi:MAG: hypothetical protein QXR39_06905 [Candidatus Methanomethylicia archaeon]